MIAMQTKRADPDLGGIINNRKGVEHGSAVAATERRVGEERRRRREGLERSVDGGDGDDALC